MISIEWLIRPSFVTTCPFVRPYRDGRYFFKNSRRMSSLFSPRSPAWAMELASSKRAVIVRSTFWRCSGRLKGKDGGLLCLQAITGETITRGTYATPIWNLLRACVRLSFSRGLILSKAQFRWRLRRHTFFSSSLVVLLPRARARKNQTVTWAPSSTTRSDGIEKKSVAFAACLASAIKSRSCHAGMPELGAGLIVPRPGKNDVVMMSIFNPPLRGAASAAGTRGLSM
jgi:hypothetical protein